MEQLDGHTDLVQWKQHHCQLYRRRCVGALGRVGLQ